MRSTPEDHHAPVGAAPGAAPVGSSRPPLRTALALVVLFAAAFAWASWRLPLDQALRPLPEPTLVLLDSSGRPFARRGAYKEAPVDAARLPRHVVDAVLAIEDRRFYTHAGLDPRGIGRALVANARAGDVEQGGSTITQQLAKTAFLDGDRTLRRKLQEALIALWLEMRLGKDEILSRYLSGIYFGDGVYGLRAAARHYFDTTPEALDLGQAAMLAGMIRAPSALAPTRDPDAAQRRARLVLRAMVETGAITPEQAAGARRPRIVQGRDGLPVGHWFADWVSPEAKAAFDADYGERRVRTTLDGRLQSHAQRVIARRLDREGAAGHAGQAALVAMRRSGEVVALVGGRDYAASQFNRATQARRQPGSAFKLFVYLAALRDGLTPDSPVDDSPLSLGGWSPENADGRYAGRIPLREAFARSSNVAAVRLAHRVGPDEVVRAARDLGIASELGDDATIALGTSEVTLLELTAAYAALAAGAAPVAPHGLPDEAGLPPMHALDQRHRAMLLDMLWTAVEQGTGRDARLPVPTFGKTGTTQDNRDALFVGLAGDLVVGVWVGNDDGSPMRGVSGGGLPARIWRDFMVRAVKSPARASAGTRSRERPRAAASAVAMPARWVRDRGHGRTHRHDRGRGHAHGHDHGHGHGHARGHGRGRANRHDDDD